MVENSGKAANVVFRTTTHDAERRRMNRDGSVDRSVSSRPLRVLFLEEGCACRSVLACAIFERALSEVAALGRAVEVDVAFIVPQAESCASGEPQVMPDATALAAADALGLSSPTVGRAVRAFREVDDSVDFDVLLVMDRFDHAEVLRQVAAYDNIFPDGRYALKARRLAGFAACTTDHCAVRNLMVDPFRRAEEDAALDISDPLYGYMASPTDRLQIAMDVAHELQASCEGLVGFLHQLNEIATHKGIGLAEEAAANMRVNDIGLGSLASRLLVDPAERAARERTAGAGAGGGGRSRGVQYINERGERVTLRWRPQRKVKGYWLCMENVKRELSLWCEEHGVPIGTMPLISDIKESGHYMIYHAISKYHGGRGRVAQRLGWRLDSRRKDHRYWTSDANIMDELGPYLDMGLDQGNGKGEGKGDGGDGGDPSKHAGPLRMPTKAALAAAGRRDLVGAIDRAGGFKAFAARAGLAISCPGRKALHPELKSWEGFVARWREFESQKEQREEGGEGGEDGTSRMPDDVLWGLRYHGGRKVVEKRLGVRL